MFTVEIVSTPQNLMFGFVSPSQTCDDNGEGELNNMSLSYSHVSDVYNITHQTRIWILAINILG